MSVTPKIPLGELARRLEWKPGTLYRLVETKKIPHYRIGGRVFFDVAEIDAWLQAQHATPVDAKTVTPAARTRAEECAALGIPTEHPFA